LCPHAPYFNILLCLTLARVKQKIVFYILQFSDLSDLRRDGTGQYFIFGNVILWDFDILPLPPSQTIQPRGPGTVNEDLDSVLSLINLHWQSECNWDLQPINYVCLVGITLQSSIADCEKWTMGQI
jgi:hypothetical protein